MPRTAHPRPAAPTTRYPTRIGAASVCALLLLLLFVRGAHLEAGGGERASGAERIRAWIEDLRSPDYATREAARLALEAEGEGASSALEAHQDDADPEVRRTARLLLQRMGREPKAETLPTRDLQGVGVVRLAGQGTLRELLDALTAAHGAFVALPEAFEEGGRLELDGGEALPFFLAIRRVGRLAGLVPMGGFDSAGRLELVRAPGAERPWAAAGPMQVQVAEVSRTRVLAPEASRRFAIGLDLQWSPAVQLVTWSTPRKIEAEDRGGRPFQPGPAMRARTTHGVSRNAVQTRIVIHLEPSADDVQADLGFLAFELPLRVRHQRKELRFAADKTLPTTQELPGPGRKDGSPDRVRLESLEGPEAERGPWTVHITAHLNGATSTRSLEVYLERADGSLQPAHAGSRFPSADGRLELTAKAYGMGEDEPVAVRVRWYAAEEQGVLPFRLVNVPLR